MIIDKSSTVNQWIHGEQFLNSNSFSLHSGAEEARELREERAKT
jgi:hypothetical protein